MADSRNEIAVFGGGCFWCTEAVFNELKGVKSVVSGYAGGRMEKPTYEDVSTGTTGHAEAIKIEFNPNEISYDNLLEVFFGTHDPTTMNRQGNDVGEQYRSVIFYANDMQKRAAEGYIKKLDASKIYKDSVVTDVVPLGEFYEAEEYHQKFYEKNPTQGYCMAVIPPKLEKLKEKYSKFLKEAQ